VEDDLPASGVEAGGLETFQDDGGAGQGGVTAERDFRAGGEPAEAIVGAGGDEVSRFRKVVLGGNGLKRGVREELVEEDDGGGVAGEAASGEGVNLEDGGAHRKIVADAGGERREGAIGSPHLRKPRRAVRIRSGGFWSTRGSLYLNRRKAGPSLRLPHRANSGRDGAPGALRSG
jgi:hypothetical protein